MRESLPVLDVPARGFTRQQAMEVDADRQQPALAVTADIVLRDEGISQAHSVEADMEAIGSAIAESGDFVVQGVKYHKAAGPGSEPTQSASRRAADEIGSSTRVEARYGKKPENLVRPYPMTADLSSNFGNGSLDVHGNDNHNNNNNNNNNNNDDDDDDDDDDHDHDDGYLIAMRTDNDESDVQSDNPNLWGQSQMASASSPATRISRCSPL